MNKTIKKFGYPQTLLKEFGYWIVLLRPAQVTLGSMVLACKENAESLANVSSEAYQELTTVTKELEQTLKKTFAMEKINYLALMMVDKQVHFHIIPRYSGSVKFRNATFTDRDWPKPPNVLQAYDLTPENYSHLKDYLIKEWA